MADELHPPIKLEDMITHADLLERYTWLTAQSVNRWKRKRGLRYFRGAKGAIVYAKSDLERALTADLDASIAEPARADPERPEMSEGDRLREQHSLRVIFGEDRKGPRRRKNPPK
jgi:hypothetical protein